jgi:tetratricopeptide (TPR) repeat protein
MRLDNVVWLLRSILLPALKQNNHLERTDLEQLSSRLVTFVRAGKQSGAGYQLADYPLIWIDTDAIAWYVEQGTLYESFADDSLPFWEQAYTLASRGIYLAEETYSDWVQDKRNEVQGYLRQSVQVLYRQYLNRFDKQGEERAILLLRRYILTHPTEEDALRPLMELLGKRECFQEALEYYQRLCESLKDEGHQPDARTQKIERYVRNKQIQRERLQPEAVNEQEKMQALISHLSIPKMITSFPEGKIIKDQNPAHDFLNLMPISVAISSPMQIDTDVLARLSTLLNPSTIVSEQEIAYVDQQTRFYWHAREETTLPTTQLYTNVIRHMDYINTLLSRSLVPVLRSYLCEITSRTVLLAGILLYDLGQYAKARQHYQVACQAALEANNPFLQAIIWGWVSFTWTYAKNYPEALNCIQYARTFAMQTSDRVIQAWLSAIESEIQAHLNNRDACFHALYGMEQSIGTSPSQETSYLFEFHPALLLGYKGVCLQQFYRQEEPATYGFLEEAKASLEQALASEAPTKRKLYYLNDLASVYARQGDVETACSYVSQSIPLLMNIGSGSKTIRKHLLQVRTLLQSHEHIPSVHTLEMQIAPLLIEMQTEEREHSHQNTRPQTEMFSFPRSSYNSGSA